ncbi:MAG: hypothetical protein ACPGUC_01605 [Gammaproteobacteria bacterium]
MNLPSIKPAPGATAFVLDGGGLLFVPGNASLHTMSASAMRVWCALEEGWSLDQLASDQEEAVALRKLLELWAGWGAVNGITTQALADPPARDWEPPRHPSANQLNKLPSYVRRDYRLLGTTVRIACESDEQMDRVHPVLAHLEVEPLEVDPLKGDQTPSEGLAVISVEQSDDGHRINVNGIVLGQVPSLSLIGPEVKYGFLLLCLHRFDYLANIHAGSLGCGDAGLLLPGPKGSGKTTLTQALAGAGYDYLSDEYAPLRRADCRVQPVPIGLCVKDSGVATMTGLRADTSDHPVHLRQDGLNVRYLPPPTQRAEPVARPLRHVIFPTYRPGHPARLEAISPLDGIARLVENIESMPRSLTLDEVSRLVATLEQVSFHTLQHDQLGEAVALIDGVTGGPNNSPKTTPND